ncbi:MAG: hypothetical protein AAGD25_36195 [Cyanobacteria bacterium P01_F01_bin.150]
MDPTLGYQERTNLSYLDLQVFDVLGWDVNYAAYNAGIDLNALYAQAIQSISEDFGIGVEAVEGAIQNGQDWHSLVNGAWRESFKQQMLDLGHGKWWQEVEQHLETITTIDEVVTTAPDDNQNMVNGGASDDILAGDSGQDFIAGVAGDDLIDGKEEMT